MNRRSARTKREISEAFLELLSQKPIQKVTVQELTQKADISRATFYTHYHDVYDLLEATRADAIEHVTQLVSKALPDGDMETFTFELFSYFDSNKELFSLIIGENGDISFLVNTLREIGEKQIDRLTQGAYQQVFAAQDEEHLHYQFIFFSGGLLHMLTDWFSHGCTTSVEEMAHMAAELIEARRDDNLAHPHRQELPL